MSKERILLMHPGEMGASIGAALVSAGHKVFWVCAGRSDQTRERAEKAGLEGCPDLVTALGRVDHMVSVCPPEFAADLAEIVRAVGFEGTYLDANAVSPRTAEGLKKQIGAGFVDGGIVGPPAWKFGSTRLYLSGSGAQRVADWFAATPVDARVIQASASALKMCYAAFTKGSSALLLAVRALAEREGVGEDLLSEWGLSQPGLALRSEVTARHTSAKAWRFEAEMMEIAQTFSDAALPSGFHAAAAEIYQRLRALRDRQAELDVVIAALLEASGEGDS